MTVETATQAEWKRQQRSQQISDYKAKKITDLLITKKLMHIFCFLIQQQFYLQLICSLIDC